MCARCPVSEGAGGGCSGDGHPRGAWSSRVLRGDRGFSAHDEGPAQNPGAGLSFCLCEAAPRFPPASCLGTAGHSQEPPRLLPCSASGHRSLPWHDPVCP